MNHKHSLSLTHLTFLHNSADIESMLFKANIVAKTLYMQNLFLQQINRKKPPDNSHQFLRCPWP